MVRILKFVFLGFAFGLPGFFFLRNAGVDVTTVVILFFIGTCAEILRISAGTCGFQQKLEPTGHGNIKKLKFFSCPVAKMYIFSILKIARVVPMEVVPMGHGNIIFDNISLKSLMTLARRLAPPTRC